MSNPLRDTPTAVTESISEHGGLNQYGKPYWRVVLAFNHTRKKRGLWHEFADGTFEQFTSDGHGKFRHNPLHALRVVDEVRDTPMWPIPNQWIVERWFPAEVWGERETWPKTSAYPEEGEYYLVLKGPGEGWQEIPELNDIKQAISMWERDYLSRPRDFDAAYAVFLAEEQAAEQRESEKAMEEFAYFYQHEMLPMLKESKSVPT